MDDFQWEQYLLKVDKFLCEKLAEIQTNERKAASSNTGTTAGPFIPGSASTYQGQSVLTNFVSTPKTPGNVTQTYVGSLEPQIPTSSYLGHQVEAPSVSIQTSNFYPAQSSNVQNFEQIQLFGTSSFYCETRQDSVGPSSYQAQPSFRNSSLQQSETSFGVSMDSTAETTYTNAYTLHIESPSAVDYQTSISLPSETHDGNQYSTFSTAPMVIRSCEPGLQTYQPVKLRVSHDENLAKFYSALNIDEKSFECSICGKRFRDRSNLKRHSTIHTTGGQKSFECDRCGAKFAQKSYLKRHYYLHIREKRFKCDRCDGKFSYLSSLKCHYRTHTGEKPYTCDICHKRFSQRVSLINHYLTHTGGRPSSNENH